MLQVIACLPFVPLWERSHLPPLVAGDYFAASAIEWRLLLLGHRLLAVRGPTWLLQWGSS